MGQVRLRYHWCWSMNEKNDNRHGYESLMKKRSRDFEQYLEK